MNIFLVAAATAARSEGFSEKLFLGAAEQAFRNVDSAPRDAVTAAALILIKIRGGAIKDRFTARDIHRHDWVGLTDRDHVQLGLDLLCDHDWIARVDLETGGRPKTEYLVRGKP